MITAKEAKNITIDVLKDAAELSETAVNQILEETDLKIKCAARAGQLQIDMSLEPIVKLNDINIEAAKRSVHLLSGYMERYGYRTAGFTNHTVMTTIYWDKA